METIDRSWNKWPIHKMMGGANKLARKRGAGIYAAGIQRLRRHRGMEYIIASD